MTLYKQITLLTTTFFVFLFFIILFTLFISIKDNLEKELSNNAQNSVTALSLSIQNTEGNISDIKTIIDAAFDNSDFKSICYRNTQNEIEYIRENYNYNNIPSWFQNLIYIDIKPTSSILSKGWKIVGTVEIVNNKNKIYTLLYEILFTTVTNLLIVYILFILLLNYIIFMMLRPLKRIEQQALSAIKNKFIIQNKIPKTKELKIVVQLINRMIIQFETIFNISNQTLLENKKILYTDELTKLNNRKYFVLKFCEYLESKKIGYAIFISIDKIYLLNQKIGYQNTNDYIFKLANYLRNSSNTFNNTLICRINPSEIIMIFPDISLKKVSGLSENIISYANSEIRTFSNLSHEEFGIHTAILRYDYYNTISDFLSSSDYALMKAKLLSHREYYIAEEKNISFGKENWEKLIKDAIKNDLFILTFRNVINIVSKKKVFTTLTFSLKINNKVYSYGDIVAPISNLNLISDVYIYIIRKILKSNIDSEKTITIQLPPQLLNEKNIYENLQDLFSSIKKRSNFELVFEIPESSINQHYENTVLLINLFDKYHFKFAISDFIAYSENLQYLKLLNPLFIKSNKKYLLDKEQKVDDLKIILTTLNINLIATGVETMDEIFNLHKLGIKTASGKVVDNLTKK